MGWLSKLNPISLVTDLGSKFLENTFINKPNAQSATDAARVSSAMAFNRSYDAYKARYQNTTKDMRAAGLNPILAATGGFSVGNAPQMASPQAFQANSPSLLGTSSAKAAAETTESETRAEENIAKKKLAMQKINESVATVFKTFAERSNITAQEQIAYAKIKQINKDVALKFMQIQKLEEEVRLTEQATMKQQAEGELAIQKKENLKRQYQILGVDLKKLQANLIQIQKIADVYKGPAGTALTYINEISKTLGLSVGAFVGKVKK